MQDLFFCFLSHFRGDLHSSEAVGRLQLNLSLFSLFALFSIYLEGLEKINRGEIRVGGFFSSLW